MGLRESAIKVYEDYEIIHQKKIENSDMILRERLKKLLNTNLLISPKDMIEVNKNGIEVDGIIFHCVRYSIIAQKLCPDCGKEIYLEIQNLVDLGRFLKIKTFNSSTHNCLGAKSGKGNGL